MLTNLKQRKEEQGFTIIEVLIVLAIAALILLIVLLAVPALQRSQRNSARKTDASRLATAANNYVTNANGNLPSAANWTTGSKSGQAILDDAGKLGQYSLQPATSPAPNKFSLATGAQAASALGAVDEVQLVTTAKCDTNNPGATVDGTSRQMAIQYSIETGSSYQVVCNDI